MVPQRPKAARSAESKAAPRDGRQEGGSVSSTEWQSGSEAPIVSERTTQGADRRGRDWSWVEASVWNERMLAALENGVKGGKWFSLMDKVYRIKTLKAAWQKVEANAGAAGGGREKGGEVWGRGGGFFGGVGGGAMTGGKRAQPK